MHLLIINHHTRISIHHYLIILAIGPKRFNQERYGRSKDNQKTRHKEVKPLQMAVWFGISFQYDFYLNINTYGKEK